MAQKMPKPALNVFEVLDIFDVPMRFGASHEGENTPWQNAR
jgi:hypothetical protein